MTAAGVLIPLAALLRLASRVACLIVIASFALFAINQTGKASTHQQEEVKGTPAATASPAHEGTAHRVLDEAADKLTSPFSGITAGSTSQWVIRGVGTFVALLVYGVACGYLARMLRIRV